MPIVPESALARAAAAVAAGDAITAERVCREILEQDPRNPHALSWLGVSLAARGRHAEAEVFFRRAALTEPENPGAHLNLGNALMELGAIGEAIFSLERALALRPDFPEALNSLGAALAGSGNHEEALKRFRQALALRPFYGEAEDNMGEALLRLGRRGEAIECFRRAVTRQPDNADFHCNLGNAFSAEQRWDEAMECYERALTLDPELHEAHYNIAVICLYRHEFKQGWLRYERRLQARDFRPSVRQALASVDLYERLPRWRGLQEAGIGEVAIWAEQGIGDQVLFSTLIPELVGLGVRFIYEVDPRLLPAYERAFPDVRFVERNEPPRDALQRTNRVLLAGSLPAFFRASRESFARQPAKLLGAPPERVAHYRKKLAALGPALKVALSWRSTRKVYWAPDKSAPLQCFAPLFRLAGVHFVDVQYGDTVVERQAAREVTGMELLHFDDVDCYNDLEELLAILEACDLLITTSNATAHFAGALGRRTWLMYPADRAPFHYWAHGGSHRCLWYPSIEIVTAAQLTEWNSLAAYVANKLEREVAGARAGPGAAAAKR